MRLILAIIVLAFAAPSVSAQIRPVIGTAAGNAALADYERGVAVIKSRDDAARNTADFRRSWAFWTNLHGHFGDDCRGAVRGGGMAGMVEWDRTNAAERDTWCTCIHDEDAFLTWHRMALYFFERVVGQAVGKANFRLPVWNAQASSQLPAAFRDEDSALFAAARNSRLNAGTAGLSAAARSTTNAMSATSYRQFNDRLENTPHGSTHCAIAQGGCPNGLMGHNASAAADPIFFIHHASMDWRYQQWLDGPNGRLPTGAHLDRAFRFVDRDGSVVRARVRDLLELDDMGYGYASVEPEARVWLAQTTRATREDRMRLRLEAVFPDPAAPGMYEAFIVTPDGRRASVGILSFFGQDGGVHRMPDGSMMPNDGLGGKTFDFDLRPAFRELGLQRGDPFTLAYEATDGLEPFVPEEEERVRRKASPRIGRSVIEADRGQ